MLENLKKINIKHNVKSTDQLGRKASKITCTIMLSVTQRKQVTQEQGSTTAKFLFLY